MRYKFSSLALLSLACVTSACGGASDPSEVALPGTDYSVPDGMMGEQPTTPSEEVDLPWSDELAQAPQEPSSGSEQSETPKAPTAVPTQYVKEWVVSPTGNDASAGTATAPLRTISRAVSLARPGHLIRVRSGTYTERILLTGSVVNGTAQAPITLIGEGKPKLVPGSSGGTQVMVERAHWKLSGFEIDMKGRQSFAASFSGNAEGSVFADSELHHGTAGAGVSFHRGANGGTLQNNLIHHFWVDGRDAHGVIVQHTSKNITVRNNVIHTNSGDSIQCHSRDGEVPAEPATNVLIEGNDLYGNYEQSLDIKTCHNVTVRRNKMHDNLPRGNGAMVVHMSAQNILIEENDFYHAGVGVGIGGNLYGPVIKGVVIQRNRFRDMRTDGGNKGGGIRLGVSDGATVLHNTFTRLPGAALEMGDGSSGPTRNPVVKNNLFDVSYAVNLRSAYSGLKMGGNLYKPAATFSKGGTLDFTKWKALGFDTTSLQADPQLNTSTLVPGPSAIDRGESLGASYCGAAPDIGLFESGC
jgi:hypothetical protein